MAGPHAQGTFDDQFDAVAGNNVAFEYSFESPLYCFLRRLSTFAKDASAGDAYVTLLINGVEVVSLADGVGMTAAIDFKVLDDIEVLQGDKITVRLNLVTSNTVHRGKVVLAYAAPLERDVVPIGYYPTYA